MDKKNLNIADRVKAIEAEAAKAGQAVPMSDVYEDVLKEDIFQESYIAPLNANYRSDSILEPFIQKVKDRVDQIVSKYNTRKHELLQSLAAQTLIKMENADTEMANKYGRYMHVLHFAFCDYYTADKDEEYRKGAEKVLERTLVMAESMATSKDADKRDLSVKLALLANIYALCETGLTSRIHHPKF